MSDKIKQLSGKYLNVGGFEITGFGEEAIILPSPESKVSSKKGLDCVAWIKLIPASQEIEVTVNLMADSPSVKILKGFEKTGVIVPFLFTWVDLGVVFEGLESRVEEVGDFKVGTEMPEIQFKITVKNVIEVKGL